MVACVFCVSDPLDQELGALTKGLASRFSGCLSQFSYARHVYKYTTNIYIKKRVCMGMPWHRNENAGILTTAFRQRTITASILANISYVCSLRLTALSIR
jgi:hypothetical protein